jgi:hypothetical protein
VWAFSHAHHKGFDTGETYLHAASRGHQFLSERFLDQITVVRMDYPTATDWQSTCTVRRS